MHSPPPMSKSDGYATFSATTDPPPSNAFSTNTRRFRIPLVTEPGYLSILTSTDCCDPLAPVQPPSHSQYTLPFSTRSAVSSFALEILSRRMGRVLIDTYRSVTLRQLKPASIGVHPIQQEVRLRGLTRETMCNPISDCGVVPWRQSQASSTCFATPDQEEMTKCKVLLTILFRGGEGRGSDSASRPEPFSDSDRKSALTSAAMFAYSEQ
ncbi:hypothetical protein BDV32DRAFT_127811 [Aspergillus pseudonomiae]|uniref:Uncharacterized protein n=1 Tax=Aspergillus pseudonomiae TaxID=1506151 RepID=A0A5N6HS16_9EURO|nr:uncharacterized protein BDV37DRAFT_183093 [Aspergillus pseudonomiae]KAB8257175.1 hypothetical protein BDV32DRAFT_127811 [Aspergillus pseudonomiae]KAE8401321.1 hypothetical protein BDV37DRAFT_183093 [Aspergillus pseudonomiae]